MNLRYNLFNLDNMKPGHNYSSPEAEERERRHQFGQPEANKQGDPRKAVNQRDFYRWCEAKATEDELREYVRDQKNPMARRKFVAALVKCETVQDFFDLTNQTHGQPKQVIEQTSLPEVKIVLE